MLQRGELHNVYQPIVASRDGRILGFEALLRWQHPTRGSIPPTTLIPLAEQSGIIGPIGLFLVGAIWSAAFGWLLVDDTEQSAGGAAAAVPVLPGAVASVEV